MAGEASQLPQLAFLAPMPQAAPQGFLRVCVCRGAPALLALLVGPWGHAGICRDPLKCSVSLLSPAWSFCRCCGQHSGEAEAGRGHPEEAAGSFGEDQQPQPFSHAVQVKQGPCWPSVACPTPVPKTTVRFFAFYPKPRLNQQPHPFSRCLWQ